jgi:inorganic pyrophosphatase/exopolyphosphatase
VIDHHALQNATIVTDAPIYIDIRPWGSMSSIITHTFLTTKRRPTKSTAGMLLCAILSDTLNLQGPTTTDWDRMMVAILVQLAEVNDVQFLASQQFKAKSSELAGLSAHALCNGDQKVFTFKTELFEGSVGFAVVETTDDDVIMSRAAELLVALNDDKEEKGLSVLFLAVVNIVSLKSNLLLLGPDEISLAEAAFTSGKLLPPVDQFSSPTVMDLGGLVSRKKDYIPAVTNAIKKGWCTPKKGSIHRSTTDVFNAAKF